MHRRCSAAADPSSALAPAAAAPAARHHHRTGVIVRTKWGNGCCWVGEHLLHLCETIYDVYFEDLWWRVKWLDDFGLLLHVTEE